MATLEAVQRRRANRAAAKAVKRSESPWVEIGRTIHVEVSVVRLSLGELLRGMSRGTRERILADILRHPDRYPDIEESAATSQAKMLMRIRDHLEGKPDRNLNPEVDPTGGTRGGMCCSSAWFDQQWEELKPVGGHYPPGGDESAMIGCEVCGTIVPPNSIASRVCDDCRPIRDHEQWGPSPSGIAICAVRGRRLKVEGVKLAHESRSALRREILQYQKTKILPK